MAELFESVMKDLDVFLTASEVQNLTKIATTAGGQVNDANTDPNSGTLPVQGEGKIDQGALVNGIDENDPIPEQNVAVTGTNPQEYLIPGSFVSHGTTASTSVQEESVKASRLAQRVLNSIKTGYQNKNADFTLLKRAIEEAILAEKAVEEAEDVETEATEAIEAAEDVEEIVSEKAGEKAAQLFIQELKKQAYFNKVQGMEFELSKQAGAKLAEEQITSLVHQKQAQDKDYSNRIGRQKAAKLIKSMLKVASKKKR